MWTGPWNGDWDGGWEGGEGAGPPGGTFIDAALSVGGAGSAQFGASVSVAAGLSAVGQSDAALGPRTTVAAGLQAAGSASAQLSGQLLASGEPCVLSPLAIAVQGLVGLDPILVATQGLLCLEIRAPEPAALPKPSGGGTAGQRARAWRRTQDLNQNLLSVVAVIVASGILEGSDP